MTGRIFVKLIIGVFCLLAVALVTVDISATQIAKDTYIQNLVRQLADKGRLLSLTFGTHGVPDGATARQIAQAAGGRLTVVRWDGTVFVDSEADAPKMENHRTRPELIRAFRGETGFDQRQSATLNIRFLYVAVPFPQGAIRLAVPLSEIEQQVGGIRARILVSTALGFLPAVFLAAALARFLSRRFAGIMAHAVQLARGNFRARLPDSDASEFGRLSQTLNETAENLQQTVEQLEREHAELERVERIRKDFVINVSHELRTPLASIQGYTETLMDGALHDPEHNMRFLAIIRHNTERLARLTQDLLTLSRIEQRRQEFEFESQPINGMLEDAVDLIRPLARKRDIQIVTEPAAEPADAWCDREAVSQILSNLVDNALKYTPVGGCITLGARRAEEFFEVYVRDTGVGIPAEDLPRLFERFYRVDKARSRELGGTGLGLSIVKHLVAAHNGTTRVESRLNQGSTFYFTLPVSQSALAGRQINTEFTAS